MNENMQQRLIIFTRYPRAGKTKTRLIPAIGAEAAAELQRRMTARTLAIAKAFRRNFPVSIEVAHEDGDAALMRQWLGNDVQYRSQSEGDLGQRMERAFRQAFDEGMQSVVIMGTDCPGVTPAHLEGAFDTVARNEVALGPTRDGGYYLIGLRRRTPQLFAGVPWGTKGVLRETLRIARDLGLSTALLEGLEDVDRPEDIADWRAASGEPGGG
ncbi:MAG: TIGR04282 family arsenosugar biosynthesis glycosyltransferase, partial [Planctomycetia bacterium]|nr:TIGR04282 family arsenosugar biosynthesis glycosyltransferase [Planctomycetia bacterium]